MVSKQRMTVQWLRMVHLAGRWNPQLSSDSLGPEDPCNSLRVCGLANLGAQGFMEPSQNSRTADEKYSWSGKWSKSNWESAGLLMACDGVSDFQ